MKEASGKREVPILVSVLVFAVILVSLVIVYILNPSELQLMLAFPLGLSIFFENLFWTIRDFPKALLAPFVIASYGLYVLLFVAMFGARKWRTFGIICFILGCVLLLNLAGCRQITTELSEIH
jgi:hypothetical protein